MSGGPISALASTASSTRVVASAVPDGFWVNLILISIPILVLSLVAAALYRIGLEPSRNTNNG